MTDRSIKIMRVGEEEHSYSRISFAPDKDWALRSPASGKFQSVGEALPGARVLGTQESKFCPARVHRWLGAPCSGVTPSLPHPASAEGVQEPGRGI